MPGFGSDLTLAARRMRRAPIPAAVIALVLALGIGVGTACYTSLRAAVLAGLPYPRADEIFSLRMALIDPMAFGSSQADPLDWWERMPGTVAAAAYAAGQTRVGDGARQATVAEVSTGFFRVMGVGPMLGRTFSHSEEARQDPLAILSYPEWRMSHGGRQDVIGSAEVLNGQRFIIIGVMPEGFGFPSQPAFFVPLRPAATDILGGATSLAVIVRMNAGLTQREVQSRVDSAVSQIILQAPWLENMGNVPGLPATLHHPYQVTAVPLRRDLLGKLEPALWALFLGSCLVFLIACTDAAFLAGARYVATLPQLAISAALGASRARLGWQALLDALLPVLAGCAGGIWIARIGDRALRSWLPSPGLADQGGGTSASATLVMALAFAAAAGAVVSAAPIIWSWRLKPGMPSRPARANLGRSPLGAAPGTALIATQIGLSMALAAGAALLLNSFRGLASSPTGVNEAGVLAVTIPASPGGSSSIGLALARLQAQPGIRMAAFTSLEPFLPTTVVIRTVRDQDGHSGAAYSQYVSGAYFSCLGIALERGRLFDQGDSLNSTRVTVISRGLAGTLWPAGDAIGRTIILEGADPFASHLKVVGVVGDTRLLYPGQPPLATIYIDYRQAPEASFAHSAYLLVKGSLPPARLGEVIESIAGRAGLDLLSGSGTAVSALRQRALSPAKGRAGLLLALAGLGLVLACVGAYGILSFRAMHLKREIAVRMALGASPLQVLRAATQQAVLAIGIGIFAGALAALWLTTYLRSLLFGLQPRDPFSFGVAAVTVTASGMIAALVPAISSARTDPCAVLREE